MNRRELLQLPLQHASLQDALHTGPRAAPGSTPGTLPEGPGTAPRLHVIAYGPHEITEHTVERVEELRAMRGRWPVLWVNVDGVRHPATLHGIADVFGLHRLAVEDVGQVGQQVQAEVYGDHLLIIAKMVRRVPELDVEQVSLCVGADYVISFQERPGDSLEPVRERLRWARGNIRSQGPDFLAYSLMDAMVDHCFPVVEHYMERLDALEDEILLHPQRRVMAALHATRRDLLTLRRSVYPLRDAMARLVREPPEGLVTPGVLVYLRDIHDHSIQILDLVEACREMGASLTDLYLSSVSNRTNDIMKVLTIFAALFIPLGFITGLYGMNVNAPPGWMRSLTVAEACMAAITAGLLFFFWRRGWLTQSG